MIDISKLSKDELIELNKKVIDRLNQISDAELLEQTNAFNVSDIVSFDNNGQKCYGVILRVNQKSISVAVSLHEKWKISPSFLKTVKKPPKKAVDLQFELFPHKNTKRMIEELGLG